MQLSGEAQTMTNHRKHKVRFEIPALSQVFAFLAWDKVGNIESLDNLGGAQLYHFRCRLVLFQAFGCVTHSSRHSVILWPALRQFLIPEMVHTATWAPFRQMPSALIPVNEGSHGWVLCNPSLLNGVWLHTASHSSGILAQRTVPGVSIKCGLWEVKECKSMEEEGGRRTTREHRDNEELL